MHLFHIECSHIFPGRQVPRFGMEFEKKVDLQNGYAKQEVKKEKDLKKPHMIIWKNYMWDGLKKISLGNNSVFD